MHGGIVRCWWELIAEGKMTSIQITLENQSSFQRDSFHVWQKLEPGSRVSFSFLSSNVWLQKETMGLFLSL